MIVIILALNLILTDRQPLLSNISSYIQIIIVYTRHCGPSRALTSTDWRVPKVRPERTPHNRARVKRATRRTTSL